VAVITGYTPAVEREGRQESLVLALQALSRFHAEAPARPAAGYDLISALSGIMFMTASSYSQPCPAWWILGSRATYLEFACAAVGLKVEAIAPRSEELDAEGQQAHFAKEMLPGIEAEIEAGRPVLVKGGFPSFGWGLWGVVTRTEGGKLFGHTCWFQYKEQPVGEEFPVQTAYAVQVRDRSKRIPIREILQHAADLYQNEGETGWTTGPGAYENWIDHVGAWTPCSEACVDLPNCNRQMAGFVRDARSTAARFLDFLNEEVPPTLRRFLPGIVNDNRAIADLLKEFATAEDPAPLVAEKSGRKSLQQALTKVMEHETRLGKRYAELAGHREWDAPPPQKKKGRGPRGKAERTKADKAKAEKAKAEKAMAEKARAEKARAEEKARGWRKISD